MDDKCDMKLPTTVLLDLDGGWGCDDDVSDAKMYKRKASVAFSDIVIMNQIDVLEPPDKNLISCTNVLWFMTFTGFAIESMLRFNMSIAIVDMIMPNEESKIESIVPKCYETTDEMSVISNASIVNSSLVRVTDRLSLEQFLLKTMNINFNKDGFDWDEHQQGLLLGSIYWSYGITQLPGGLLARKYGTKLIFGLANLITSILCLLIPISSYIDIRLVLALRVIQGLFLGMTWPAMHHMVAYWIPPNERSRFFTSYLGVSGGIAICSPMFGYLIAWSSWEWIFHLCAVIGIFWYIGWVYLIYDTPAKHPRIDIEEREYIEFSLKDSLDQDKTKVPWISILTSVPVWVNALFCFGTSWGMLTLTHQTPTYFNNIFGLDIKNTGILSGLPHITKIFLAYFVAKYADYLLKSDTMSRRNVRICAGSISNILFGIFVLGLAYSGCNYTWAVILQILGHTVNGAISASGLANILDLSPNFSGIIMGLVRVIYIMPGFISPFIVGELTLDNQTLQQWKHIYLITSIVLIGTGIIYVFFTETKVQKWNNISETKCTENDEHK